MHRWWDGQWPSSQAGCYKNDVPVNDTYFEVHLLVIADMHLAKLHIRCACIVWDAQPTISQETPFACAAPALLVSPSIVP